MEKHLKRLLCSALFLIILIYFSVGHLVLAFPLPEFFDRHPFYIGLVQMLLTIDVVIINKELFMNGFTGLFNKRPNMDTLVALGCAASFLYSVFSVGMIARGALLGDNMLQDRYLHELYFVSTAMILTLITVGKYLEAMHQDMTTDALKSLMKLAPNMATIIDENGDEKQVSIENVRIGDVFVVRPGEHIPVDGVIIEGSSAIDESALTGESIPVDKREGASVSAATLNKSGFIKCRAERVGVDTTLSQIIKTVSDAASAKTPIANIADRISGKFVPGVMIISLLTLIIWLMAGESFGYSLTRAIAVLVISCPYAIGLAAPVAVMVGNGIGARNGIMFKSATALENTGRTEIVVLDKTGTLTKGEPVVTDVFSTDSICSSGYTAGKYSNYDEELLRMAGILESRSEHPLAKAVNVYIKELNVDCSTTEEVRDFEVFPGNGLTIKIGDSILRGGNLEFIREYVRIPGEIVERADVLADEGKTAIYYAIDRRLIGIIAVADTLKKDSKEAVSRIKSMGLQVVMLTGDHEKTAAAIGRQIGVQDIIAGVMPEGKEKVVEDLSKKGKVLMVGDGINDAPALIKADIGMAIGEGCDVAIDAADIVLMKNSLMDIAAAIRISKATLWNIRENLFWAFFYNIIGIPIAAGILIKTFGFGISPVFCAVVMSLSSLFVLGNALRLNFIDLEEK